MKKAISNKQIRDFKKAFDKDRANRIAQNAVIRNGLQHTAENYQAAREDRNVFSVMVEQPGITDQKHSGRCWMFAGLNFLRNRAVKNLDVENFELSQNYTLFYDKLEKANWFYENILETAEEPVHSRTLDYLLAAPLNDGGQWDMLRNLIRKYGLVPKEAMPETFSSSNTALMDKYLTTRLREDAVKLRRAKRKGKSDAECRRMKEEMLETVWRILAICLGNPPEKFTFEYRDKKKKFHRSESITPKEFYDQYIGADLDAYVSIINAPTADKPFHRSYTVKYLGNVKEDGGVRYLNLPLEEFKELAVRQLKDGTPVWFGSDVGQFSSREGLMDPDAYPYGQLLDTKFSMSKAERLDYGDSLMTHAMVLQGVNLDEKGRPDRWRVENSWGKETGFDGYMVMSDKWFDEFTYQLVIDRKYLSPEQLEEYALDPIVLDPWDPMGSLAERG